MKAAAPSPWPLLLSRLRLARRAVFTRAELDEAGLDAEDLLRLRIIERMDGAQWRPPDCEQVCMPNLDLESRRCDGFVGVACPDEPACWPGWQWLPVTALENYCSRPSGCLPRCGSRTALSRLTLPSSHRSSLWAFWHAVAGAFRWSGWHSQTTPSMQYAVVWRTNSMAMALSCF